MVVIADCEAPKNVVHDITLFKSTGEKDPIKVGLADGQMASARYEGWIDIWLEKRTNLTLGNIYYVRELRLNMMVCHCLDRSGTATKFISGCCKLSHKKYRNCFLGQVQLRERESNGLFVANITPPKTVRLNMNLARSTAKSINYMTNGCPSDLWNRQFGHANQIKILKMVRQHK